MVNNRALLIVRPNRFIGPVLLVLVCLSACVNFLVGCGGEESNPSWHRIADTPEPYPSSDRAMAYDESRRRFVIHGGTIVPDAWEFDGTQWTDVSVTDGPPSRQGMALCYDRGNGRLFLFGGIGETDGGRRSFNDLWIHDQQGWHVSVSTNPPDARYNAELCWDSDRNRLILFGGNSGASIDRYDTWEWSDGTWTEIVTDSRPPFPHRSGMIFDPTHHRVVLFGGARNDTYSDETWIYTPGEWSRLFPTSHPSNRTEPAMTIDPSDGSILLFGGTKNDHAEVDKLADLWRLSGDEWSLIHDYAPTTQVARPFIWLDPAGTMWLFSSYDYPGLVWSVVYKVLADRLEVVPPPEQPILSGASRLAYDRHQRRYILQKNYGETWSYADSTWRKLPQGGLDQVDYPWSEFSLVYDGWHDSVRLFPWPEYYFAGSGVSGRPLIWFELIDDAWVKHPAVPSAPINSGFALAADENRRVTVLFGGILPQQNYGVGFIYSNDTWEFDDLAWRKIEMPTAPAPRAGALMVYDPHRRTFLLFGGHNEDIYYRDTWEYDGRDWRSIATVHAPERASVMVYSAARDAMLLFEDKSEDYFTPLRVWQFDGGDWQAIEFHDAPRGRLQPAVAADADAGAIMLYGGCFQQDNDSLYFSDQWELRP